jgi:type II secretory pathway component PulL
LIKLQNSFSRTLLTLSTLVVLVPVTLFFQNLAKSEQYLTEDEWNESFELAYGSILPDFYGLGEEGFQARWLSNKEQSAVHCNFAVHCVFIKLATIAECEKGVVVEFFVFDKDDKQIAQEQTPVFLIKSGQYVDVELDSIKLNEKGFIEPTDAHCSDLLPAI